MATKTPKKATTKAIAKAEQETSESFDFFSTLKTGNKYTDSKSSVKELEFIDTGCYAFNAVLSGDIYKGFPNNKFIMLAGEQAVGKTFFAIYGFCKPLVEMGYFIYYIDTENAVEDDTLIGFGLKPNQFKIIKEDVVEEVNTRMTTILNKIEEAKGKAIQNKLKCAFVLDSQGMLDTIKARKDSEEAYFVRDMTAQQKLRQLYRSITSRCGELGIPMLITNHVYANIGAYGNQSKIAGGLGAIYACSVILHLTKKQYKEGTVKKGIVVTATGAKQRITRDGMQSQMYLNYERGLNKYYGLHIFAEEAGLLEKYSESTHGKKGVVGPERAGNANWYVIKDPKIEPSKWIVCKEYDIHTQATIGTILDEINSYVNSRFKLSKPSDFSYDDTEDTGVEIDSEELVDVDTALDKAKKRAKDEGIDVDDIDDIDDVVDEEDV